MDLTKMLAVMTTEKLEKILKENIALRTALLEVSRLLEGSACDDCNDPTCQSVRNAIEAIEKALGA